MLDPLKVIHYALAIKLELGFNNIKEAKEIVDELWEYATYGQSNRKITSIKQQTINDHNLMVNKRLT